MKKIRSITFEDSLDQDLGPIGTPKRDRYEKEMLFCIAGAHTKVRRKEFNFTHEDLAARTGLDLKTIRQVERGKGNCWISDIKKVWQQVGVGYNEEGFYYFTPEWTKPKPSLKKKLTKPSTSLRTLVG